MPNLAHRPEATSWGRGGIRNHGNRNHGDVSNWAVWGYLPVATIFLTVWLHGIALAQSQTPAPGQAAAAAPVQLKLDTGQEIFEAACIGCHGPGGKGLPETTLGFAHPATYPDFSDCNGSTRERTFDWKVTIHEGGHGRGFSE